jgi:SAM-dependent methyltransferase
MTPVTTRGIDDMIGRYDRRTRWWYRVFRPPLPLISNPREAMLPAGVDGRRLLVGGAGAGHHPGWITIDLARSPGVSVLCSVEALPFCDGAFAAIECDAVLEHVAAPQPAIEQLERVLAPGGHLHVVVPFNHPFHEYPADYQRWTVDGLRRFLGRFEVLEAGVRTGPTATLLTFVLEYVKICAPRPLRRPAYAAAGWVLWPLRYLDVWLNRRPDAHILANSIYALARKPR